MRKLSHYEQHWRDRRASSTSAPVPPPPADVPEATVEDPTPIEEPVVEPGAAPEDPTPTAVEETVAEEVDAGSPGPPGESRADRKKRLKQERAERRRGDGGGP